MRNESNKLYTESDKIKHESAEAKTKDKDNDDNIISNDYKLLNEIRWTF